MTVTNPNVFDTIGATLVVHDDGSKTISIMIDGIQRERTAYYGQNLTNIYRAFVGSVVSPYALEMMDHYYDTLVWSQTGDTLPFHEPENWEGEVVEFFMANRDLLTTVEPWASDPSQAGHDFALTRNGHGTGFWDRRVYRDAIGNLRDFGMATVLAGDKLTESAKSFGEYNLEITDYNER